MKPNERLGLKPHTNRERPTLRSWPIERQKMDTLRRGPFRGWCGIRRARYVTLGNHGELRRERRRKRLMGLA